MKCPHCLTSYHDNKELVFTGKDRDSEWAIYKRLCPACNRFIISLADVQLYQERVFQIRGERLLYPKGINRTLPTDDIPAKYREDFVEACHVISDSAKASAALSRRCLQNILRDIAKVKPGNLGDEIQQVLDAQHLPSHLSESIDAIRHIGNFAAHPLKSTASGEVLPVEPGEAEWSLDLLEGLFDFYFIQPAILKKKRDALNAKLAQAGKKPMK